MLVINQRRTFYYFRSKVNLLFMITLGSEHISFPTHDFIWNEKKNPSRALGRVIRKFDHE